MLEPVYTRCSQTVFAEFVIGSGVLRRDVGALLDTIRFRVDGDLPPKKDGAVSMWNKPAEVRRLVALRATALGALKGRRPFERSIRLTLRVHVGLRSNPRSGDLDNFVTGVCDGLMVAHTRSMIHPLFEEPMHRDIHPSRTIAIADDSQVVRVDAEKLSDLYDRKWYEVELEGA